MGLSRAAAVLWLLALSTTSCMAKMMEQQQMSPHVLLRRALRGDTEDDKMDADPVDDDECESIFLKAAEYTDTSEYLMLADDAGLPSDAAIFNPEKNVTVFIPTNDLMLEVAELMAEELGTTVDEMKDDKENVLELMEHFVVEGTIEPGKPFKTVAGEDGDEEWIWKKIPDPEDDSTEINVIWLEGSDGDPVYYILDEADIDTSMDAAPCPEDEEEEDDEEDDDADEEDEEDEDGDKEDEEDDEDDEEEEEPDKDNLTGRRLHQISSTGSIFNRYGANTHRRAYRMSSRSSGSRGYRFINA